MSSKKENILDKIDGEQALEILGIIAKDKSIAGKIKEIAIQHLSEIDVESIASDVFDDLNGLEMELFVKDNFPDW